MTNYLPFFRVSLACCLLAGCASVSSTTTVTKPDGTVTTTTTVKKGVDAKALKSGEAISAHAAALYLGGKAESR